jgi:uroporphyrinogen-III synthase
MAVPVLVTRPRREALEWVATLAARGLDARALPLIDITGPDDAAPVARAWHSLASYRALMFVSANAVDGFFAGADRQWPADLKAWATGPGTAAALCAAGVPRHQIVVPAADAAQFDSETLWSLVGPAVRPGDPVLIVRGDDEGAAGGTASPQPGAGRDWLARQVLAQGGLVDFVVSYVRRCPNWPADVRAQAARAAGDGTVWIFSSSEAVRHLQQLLPGQSWAGALAVATHPRIAEAAARAGFGRCLTCRPALADVVASIESLS